MCLGRPQIDVCNSKVVFLHLSTHHTEACNVFPQMKYLSPEPEKQNKVVLARGSEGGTRSWGGRVCSCEVRGARRWAPRCPPRGPLTRGGRAAAPRGNKGPRGPSNPDGGCRDPARAANVRSEPAGLSPKELRPLPVWSWSFRCQEKATVFPSLLTILDY